MADDRSDRPKRKRRPLISSADVRLWAKVVEKAKPLPETPPVALPDDDAEPDPPDIDDYPSPRLAPMRESERRVAKLQGELSHGTTAGIDKRTAERFKKGEMEVQGRLDLHGMTREAAHGALRRFLADCAARQRRFVIVVTGKGLRSEGNGILRSEVPRWLNEPELRTLILSFTYAQPRDGGQGALYVLLKRDRNE